MKLLRTLIVDDALIARDILESYINKIPFLQLAGKCKNAMEAYPILTEQEIDIVLLDINMPEMNGIEFIKTLQKPPLIIFTTAYTKYAVKSYELNATDYLLKPISFERFLQAINKACISLQPQYALDKDILFVRADRKLIKIDLSKLWLIEGSKVYTKLWIDQTRILVHSTMKHIEEQLIFLPYFIRVNKSYIINIKFVNEVEGNIITVKNKTITIGSTYRTEIKKAFDIYKLF